MKALILFFGTFFLVAFTDNSHIEKSTYQGVAKDLKSQGFIYREIHKEIHDKNKHVITQTDFVDSKNYVFAKRTLDFSKSKIKPDYSLTDYRNGLMEKVTYNTSGITITFRENTNAKPIVKTIEVPEPAIVDGGFNYFVKQEWSSLMNGNASYFNFVSTERQTYYRFRILVDEEKTNRNSQQVVVRMEPSNTILRALVDPIFITYNTNTKQIINYKGISNIKDDNGDNYFAILTYPTVGP